jgi:hypothetical protein
MNYLAIALVIVIIIIIYYLYVYFTNNALVSGLQPLNSKLSWTYDKLLNPTSTKFSYQCWLFLTNPATTETPIFFRGDASANSTFRLSASGDSLSLYSGTSANSQKKIMTITDKIPIQKWFYLVINVSQKNIEAYINGKLVKTVNSTELQPPTMLEGLTIGDTSLKGYVIKFIRLPETLDAQTVQNNYLRGNGLNNWVSSIFPYGMNFTISNGESASRVLKVF